MKIVGIIIIVIVAFIGANSNVKTRTVSPLSDCLQEASDERDIEMNYCFLMWNTQSQIYQCLSGVSDRYDRDTTACYRQYNGR